MSTTTAEELPSRLPRYRETPRQRGRTLLVGIFGLLAIVGAVAAVVFALDAGGTEGAVLSIGYALVPLPFLIWAFWWLDRYEPEPRRYLFAAFVWGAVVAVAIALPLELLAGELFDLSLAELASVVAPVAEEPAKGLFLLLTFVRMRRVIDGVLDGLILAGIVGIGFAFFENIGYYAASYLGGPDMPIDGAQAATVTFVVRGIVSPLAHPLFTAAFGIALGLAVSRRTTGAKIVLGVVGMAVSIALHGLWNASAVYAAGAGFVVVYLALGAALAGLIGYAVVVRLRQVRTLEQSLSYVAQRGWIHPAEIPYLSRFAYRKQARQYARREHGRRADAAVRRYQRLATEMAFLHDAVMMGRRKPRGVERTYALLDAMQEVRPWVRLPPAIRPR